MAATRELTADERRKLDEAWQTYLDESLEAVVAADTGRLNDAWAAYQRTYADLGIVATLAGYRVNDGLR